jgi:hypothetical protein
MTATIWFLILTSLNGGQPIAVKMFDSQAACVIARITMQQDIDEREASGNYPGTSPGDITARCESREVK